MSFEYWGYTFEGAWEDPTYLESRAGVYAVWCNSETIWTVLHVGESEDVKNSVVHHGGADDWKKRCAGKLYYAATYTPGLPQAGRQEIVDKVKSLHPDVTVG